jgi:ubiquinol-cytochrome c reductase cytochrome b subunit
LLLTGTFLSLVFEPSMTQVAYHGSYTKLNGIRMSEAYQSTLKISFDVRGGLLIRQIHHWAADLFMVAICVHMLRHFFTGSYRKPREINWLIGIVIFALVLVEGLFGYSLPDDQLSGAGLRIMEGVLLGIPVVGTYAVFFLFGGQFPGTSIVPRMYIIHVLLIPGILLVLVTVHVLMTFHQKHTAMPTINQSERIETGSPFYPHFMAKGTAWFFFIFGVLALLATFAQINPIWLYGPYSPAAISSASQPDWYLGMLEGALRMMPAWEINVLGHTVTMSVLIPFALPLTIILGGAAIWPWFEAWATGDKSVHHVLDRPRNVPVRTGIGIAAVVFYGVLWAEGSNDVISDKLHIPLYTVTWAARVLVIAGPVVAFELTRRICLGLQRKDREMLEHGVESGIIRQTPEGGFVEAATPASAEERAVLEPRNGTSVRRIPARVTDDNGVPVPGSGTVRGTLRAAASRAFIATLPIPPGNGHGGNGQSGNGHGGNGHATALDRSEGTGHADPAERPPADGQA